MNTAGQIKFILKQVEREHPKCVEHIADLLGGFGILGRGAGSGNDLLALARHGFHHQALSCFIASISPYLPGDSIKWIVSTLHDSDDRCFDDCLTVEASMILLSIACVFALAVIATGSAAGACDYTFLPHPELFRQKPFELVAINGDLRLAAYPLLAGLYGLPV